MPSFLRKARTSSSVFPMRYAICRSENPSDLALMSNSDVMALQKSGKVSITNSRLTSTAYHFPSPLCLHECARFRPRLHGESSSTVPTASGYLTRVGTHQRGWQQMNSLMVD